MSWESCMNAKILDKYGRKAFECAVDLDRNHLEEAARCICEVDPSMKMAEVYAQLTLWAAECI
jgi:hypothetical protein